MQHTNILICGSGIIGLTIARELIRRGHTDIIILEKEGAVGRHASGRNSGVLHAGIYYTPDTVKARFCLAGNLLMQEYCEKNNLPLVKSGKVIVASEPAQLDTLYELYDRAVRNGARVDLVDEKELAGIEPNARTYKKAIYSRHTAIVDPKKILESLQREILDSGKAAIQYNVGFAGLKGGKTIHTTAGDMQFETFINAAGAHSEKIARNFGVGEQYKILPFKGVYRQLKKEKTGLVRGNIYPVPDIRNPFLGVHFTKSVYGDVYLGPTAIPAFGRENYGVLQGIDSESVEILLRDLGLFIRNKEFRGLALSESKKYFLKFFFKDARKLVKNLDPEDIRPSAKVGIRPQLINLHTGELVMDHVIERGDNNSIHVLNAISPAFTSSLAFAKMIVKGYIE